MRQILKTKYLGPTNTKGSRIKASCEAKSITINWNHSLDVEQNHKRALVTLHVQLGWSDYYYLVFGWDKHSMIAVQVSNVKRRK